MKLPKFLFAGAASVLFVLPALAQMGQVEGYVNGTDGKAIQGAVVGFDRLDAKQHTEITTDQKGHFQIASLMNGDYAVTVSVGGQLRDRRPFFHVSPGRQDATAGNSAVGLIFNLKPIAAAQAEMARGAAKEAKSGDHSADSTILTQTPRR